MSGGGGMSAHSAGADSASPLEGLGLERMSLGGNASRAASPVREWQREREREREERERERERVGVLPKTLSSAYSYAMEDVRRAAAGGPQVSYFILFYF